MPFTPVHPAIVLPLKYLPKKWISLTALIIGSVMPDLESFIKLRPEKNFSHTWLGFLYLGMPGGILLSFFFHNVIRDPLIANLPPILQRKFSKFLGFNWTKQFREHWFVVIICLFIGGASHFFWDSFSHYSHFTATFPALHGSTFIFGKEIEIIFLIQYFSTLFGLLVILFFIARMPVGKTIEVSRHFLQYWVLTLLVAIGIFVVRIDLLIDQSLDGYIITFVSAFTFGLCTASFIFGKSEPI